MKLRVIDGRDRRLLEHKTPLPPLGPQTQLWRYMDLGKLLLLLVKRRVFIPTLSTLRRNDDPKETLLPSYSDEDLPRRLFDGPDGDEAWKWLENQVERRRLDPRATASDPRFLAMFWNDPLVRPGILLEEWLAQLSTRRAVWCWASPTNPEFPTDPHESLALWNSYAPSGIAIKTTFQAICNAVAASKELKNQEEGTAFRVKYRKQGYAINELIEQDPLERPFRPYAFKNIGYQFEQEVRIIFPVNGEMNRPGVTVGIDPHLLLKGGEVVVSPYVAEQEADDLVKIIKRLLKDDPNIVVRQSSERQKMPHEVSGPIKEFMAAGPKKEPDPFAEEADLPVLLREL